VNAFLSTLSAGLLVLFGGAGGAFLLRWFDDRRAARERRDWLAGAIDTVLAELAANRTNLAMRIDEADWQGRFVGFEQAYREAQLRMARELPWDARDALYLVYEGLRSPTWLYRIEKVDAGVGGQVHEHVMLVKEKAEELRVNMSDAARRLQRERDSLGPRYRYHPPDLSE
jgi:hypothetical protein